MKSGDINKFPSIDKKQKSGYQSPLIDSKKILSYFKEANDSKILRKNKLLLESFIV
jgi:hypothetical protein